MRSFLRSIKGLLVLFIIIILFFLYIVFSLYSEQKAEQFSFHTTNLQSIGKLKSDFIDKWYHERSADGYYLFNNVPFNQLVQNLLRNSSPADSSFLVSYLSPMANNHDYSNIFILGKEGNILLSLNPEASTKIDPDFLNSAIQNRKLVFSSFYKDSSLGLLNLDIYIPIFSNNNFISSVIIKVDPNKSLFPQISSWQKTHSSGESLIISPVSDSILFISPLKSIPNFYTYELHDSNSEFIPSKVLKGKKGILQGIDYRGVEVIADVRKINNAEWYLVTKINLDEVYLPVNKYFINYIIILCLIVFLGGLSLLFYHTRLNFNHLKKISESESKLKIILDHSTNLFYSHSADNKISYISSQSYQILGYKPKELMINWHTLTTDNPVNLIGYELTQKAITTGKIQPSYELELRKKDGSLIWVEVHEAPVLKNGKTVSIVGSLTEITQRKKAEKALYESEEIFRHFMENSPIYVFFKDENIRSLRLSNNYEKMLGRPLNEVLGKTMDELFPSELAKSMIEDDKKILNEGKTIVVNEELNGKYYTTIKFPIMIDGHSRYLAGYTIDITEQHLAEQALRESEEKYRNLFENILDGVYKSTPEGKFIEVNDSLVRMLGYENKDELLKLNIISQLYFRPEDRENAISDIDSKKMSVFRLRKKDGSEVWVEDHGIFTRDENGKVLYYEGILRDITDRRNTDERIKTLSQALEQSPISVIIADPGGYIEYVNPKFTELCGYSGSEVIGKNSRLFKTGELIGDNNEFWDTINSGKEWRRELVNKKKNGELYWANTIVSPIVNKEGEITHLVGLEEDITEKKKMIEELIISKEKAEEMNRIKSYFFANMSHELRTPFVGIIGYAELLLQVITENESREMVESILYSSNRLMDTMNKILTLTSLEFEPPSFIAAKLDFNDLLDECYRTFFPAANNKKLFFKVQKLVKPLVIYTDVKLLRDLLNNLISNAIKYTLEGGVEICCFVSQNHSLEYLNISISDTGIGIPKEKQDQIWLAFRQVSEGFNRSFEGTGLGLTITKKYIELLGASIDLESEINKGSKFIIKIPINKPED